MTILVFTRYRYVPLYRKSPPSNGTSTETTIYRQQGVLLTRAAGATSTITAPPSATTTLYTTSSRPLSSNTRSRAARRAPSRSATVLSNTYSTQIHSIIYSMPRDMTCSTTSRLTIVGGSLFNVVLPGRLNNLGSHDMRLVDED